MKELVGTVVSARFSHTRIVAVNNSMDHKKYNKTFIRTKRYAVHDANNISQLGAKVKIRENTPISKTKRWVLVDILE